VVTRRVCTACHNPHAPDPIHLESLPPPQRPRTELGSAVEEPSSGEQNDAEVSP